MREAAQGGNERSCEKRSREEHDSLCRPPGTSALDSLYRPGTSTFEKCEHSTTLVQGGAAAPCGKGGGEKYAL